MSTRDDRYRAMEMLSALGAPDHSLHVIVHAGDPASKSRARVVRGRAYTPRATQVAQEALAWDLRGIEPFKGNVAVACIFHRSNRQRIDVDNLLKLVLDAATQARVWEDDSQVTAVLAILEHDPDAPRTVVAFAHHESSMGRGPDSVPKCAVCGTPFNSYGNPRRRHCSRECRMTLAEPVVCPSCGKQFKRRSGNQKYCSNTCRGAATRTKPTCEVCGARLSRAGYRRCRSCWQGKREVVVTELAATVAEVGPELEAAA